MKHKSWIIPVILFAADRVAKHVAGENAYLNRGLVGSVPVGPWAELIITIAAGFLFISYSVPSRFRRPLDQFAVLLVFGGAVSNIMDRLAVGGVIDYLHLPPLTTFNLADTMIIGGALLLILKKYERHE